ncbi:MAG: hypothetical protein IT494_06770 [Gammaproteobacteria bacterium]|nr:hypothetical protein [Gammaproteobacteria bacterium]
MRTISSTVVSVFPHTIRAIGIRQEAHDIVIKGLIVRAAQLIGQIQYFIGRVIRQVSIRDRGKINLAPFSLE